MCCLWIEIREWKIMTEDAIKTAWRKYKAHGMTIFINFINHLARFLSTYWRTWTVQGIREHWMSSINLLSSYKLHIQRSQWSRVLLHNNWSLNRRASVCVDFMAYSEATRKAVINSKPRAYSIFSQLWERILLNLKAIWKLWCNHNGDKLT